MLVRKVLHKINKTEIWIKDNKFNPNIHEKIRGCEAIPKSVAFPVIPREQRIEIVANSIKQAVEKGEKTFEKKKELSYNIDELKALNFFQLKKIAREKGIQISNKSTKNEILARLTN